MTDEVIEIITITVEGTYPADGLAHRYKFISDLLDVLMIKGYTVTSVGDKPKLNLHPGSPSFPRDVQPPSYWNSDKNGN